ncbi:MAG: sensor domain-containing diguanylate cyclase [Candidatus Tantalella remota]|nr:sensor domain-containing diguanylate cyclase [Candidatus Tantalella remota]
MTPFAKRNLLRIISVLLFGGFLYSINRFVPALRDNVQHLEFIVLSLMIMISLAVMLLWSLLGVFAGLASFLIALLFLYGPLTDMNPYYYSVLIMAFFLSSFIGYNVYRKINLSDQKYTVSMEKIQEDTNLIGNHRKNRDAEVVAMGEKVNSLLKLKNSADKLSLSLSEDDIMKIVSEEIFNIFAGDTRVLLFMTKEDRSELNLSHTVKSRARKAFEKKKGSIYDRWVLKNMKSLLVKDIGKDFRFSIENEDSDDDAVSLMIKPLISESNLLGIIRVDSPRGSEFAQHELRILDIIGELASVAIENSRLYRQTEELSIKDSLTGLYVHRYFMERLEEEVKRGLRSDTSFALLMFDIDDFKEFNDEHGHLSGDAVLKNIGRILWSRTSAGDMVVRYGGEEFTFLALGYDKEKAIKLAEDIREEIGKAAVTLRRKKYFVTVSVGVAMFPADAKLREDLIWEADRCLYKAKSEGKNRICSK